VSIESTNLNLIPILRALLREESVVGAARQVSLSQPAVSGALARLREVLDDPLLVRVGRSMRLTPRAEKMKLRVEHICSEIEHLFEPEVFDPGTADIAFVVAAPDYLAFLLSKALLVRLRDEAPGRIRFVDPPLNLHELLRDSTIDLGVAGNFHIWPNVEYESLFYERVVAVVANDHPLAKRSRVRSADLVKYPGVNMFTSGISSRRVTRPPTGVPSLDYASQIVVGQFTDAVLLAVESPTVARAPATLAEYLSTILPISVVQLSGEYDRIDTGMFWVPVQQDGPEHLWLRAVIRETLAPLKEQLARVASASVVGRSGGLAGDLDRWAKPGSAPGRI
jgi:DNA-binding transcriptional LysR family regulator